MHQAEAAIQEKPNAGLSEKDPSIADHIEQDPVKDESNSGDEGNLVYDNIDEEPEIHWRTWVAMLSMFLLNFVQVFALQGPPAVLDFIGENLDATASQTWVPNSLSLVQAVISPLLSSISDVFQARKALLVGTSLISFIGSAIAPGSQTIGRLIAAQVLIGFGFASVPLAYAVPSEIMPRKWRPLVQSAMNIAASLGAISGPLIIGAFTDGNIKNWRDFYWIQFAFWGLTAISIFFGYRPPKRHTRLDHLTWYQKVAKLDLPGFFLLTAGLTLFLVGLNLGGGLFAWGNVRVIATLVIGLVVFLCFGLYEWKGTKTGIVHHDLFQGGKNGGRTFAICLLLMFVEGVLLFSYVIFYPVISSSLFTENAFTLAVRAMPFWIVCGLTTILWGYWSSRFRTIRWPLFGGFLLYTGGIVGLATIQPGQGINQLCFGGLAGAGMGAPLVIIIAGVQLSTPHHLIATATAVTTSTRAVAATIFTAIYAAAFRNRLAVKMPADVAAAAAKAGLPTASIMAFVAAIAGNNAAALGKVPGVTPAIIAAGAEAAKQALADSIRVVYIIAAPFGAAACIACFFLGSMRKTMTYRVDAPLEDLHAKNRSVKDLTHA